ncbi:MAG: hypothetical protein ACI8PB_004575 [Desulforhopalus sp.]|jgi:hypothetical protein
MSGGGVFISLKSAYIPYAFLPGSSSETNTLREVGMHITCPVQKTTRKFTSLWTRLILTHPDYKKKKMHPL